MSAFYSNTVASVSKPPLLVVLCPQDQSGWCKQVKPDLTLRYPDSTDGTVFDSSQKRDMTSFTSSTRRTRSRRKSQSELSRL